MKKLFIILVIFILISSFNIFRVSSTILVEIWPMFHHDLQHTGQSPYDTSRNDGTLKWRYQTGSGIISSPAIGSDGTIYVGSLDSYLYSLNPEGTLKWRYQTGSGIGSSPAISSNGTIYVGSDDHYLYALNPDGTLKWRYQTGSGIGSSPAISSDGTIYVGSDDYYLYALNPDGTLKWRYQTGVNINSSPAIGSDGTIYVGSHDHYIEGLDDRYLYALNPNGTLKWKFRTGDRIFSSPAISSDGTIYVGSWDNYLYAIGPVSYSITVNVIDSGAVSKNPDKPFYNSEESVTLTATPSTGFHFIGWKGDIAQGHETDNPLRVTMDAHKTITATFEINTYTITPSAGIGGTILPSGTITVNYGDSKPFMITPSTGYKISDVKVDGVSVGIVSSYTFSNIIANHTIGAIFKKEIITITIILQIGNNSFTVNGVPNALDSPPVIKNSRTLLPIRAIIESLGGTVSWEATEKKVTVILGSKTIELWIGKSIAKVNGIDTPIDSTNSKVVPEIINSRTMLPLRFVTENLGCDVQWDGITKTITITYQAP